MIDVLFILLIFFMVTSTYLDLRMIPMAERADSAPEPASAPAAPGAPLLLRLGADGTVRHRGQVLDPAATQALVAADPALQVVILPSGQAPAQALVTLLDGLSQAGATRVQVLRVEASP